MIVFGHRGAGGLEPENTLRGVERALSLGVDGVEVDVYATQGEVLVFHDRRLERLTNREGLLLETSLPTLRSLDVGGGERIPTLREVLDLVKGRVLVNVELKGPDTAKPVISLVNEYVRQNGWAYEQIILSSFNHPELELAKSLEPNCRTGVLFHGVPLDLKPLCDRCGASSVHLSVDFVNEEIVEKAHANGLKVYVYTVNHPDDVKWLAELSVDGIFSDFPDRIL